MKVNIHIFEARTVKALKYDWELTFPELRSEEGVDVYLSSTELSDTVDDAVEAANKVIVKLGVEIGEFKTPDACKDSYSLE